MAVVRSPSYFARWPRPKKPQHLTAHDCINLRLPSYGGLYAWEFEKGGREVKVRVEGKLVFNTIAPTLNAALARDARGAVVAAGSQTIVFSVRHRTSPTG